MFSVPGEWVDRTGRSRPRVPIQRIVVLKPDHIGDLLIAARGFELLRHYFPNAKIDLICGPWNVALAQRLGYFDDIYGVNLFHEISGEQGDLDVAIAARRAGVQQLAELCLGPYDIAIDMRYDTNSRRTLPTIDARVYAGYGSVREFPFLDIVLPMHFGDNSPNSPTDVVMSSHQFHSTSGIIDASVSLGRGSGLIQSERSFVELDFVVTGAKSPADCLTVPSDLRPLGIALCSLSLTTLVVAGLGSTNKPLPQEMLPWDPSITLVSGWASPEDWGVWGIGSVCRLRVALPPSQGESSICVDCSLLAHVNPANPKIRCSLRAPGSITSPTIEFINPTNQGHVSIEILRDEMALLLASDAFRLNAGRSEGSIRIYLPMQVTKEMELVLTIRGLTSNAILMRRAVGVNDLRSGLCDIPVNCLVEIGDEAMSFEVTTDSPRLFSGARIELMTLRLNNRMKLNTPIAHMDTLARMLVLRVAMEFSDVAPFGQSDQIADRLAAPVEGGSDAVELLRDRIGYWKQIGHCVVGIALGCNSEIRKWPHHYFVEIARRLLALHRVAIVFFGSSGEKAEAAEACRQLKLDPDLHVMCGSARLHELGRLMQPLDLFIASNTGSVHYAGRVGVRTIGIYAGTNHPREWGPVGENTSWVYRDEQCAVCSLTLLKDCHFGHVCLGNLLPSDVLPIVIPEVLAILSQRLPTTVAT